MKGLVVFLCLFLHSFSPLQAEEIDLSSCEKSIYSKNGEDGVLVKIFKHLVPSDHFYVEWGAREGMYGSITCLLRKQNWEGVLFDRSYENPLLGLQQEFVTAENANTLLEKYAVPSDFALLSINISYNSFYLWKAVDDKRYRPAVVVIEYNATHLPEEDRVVKYRPFFCGDGTNYFGASILALYNLGRSKGYSLVYAESTGLTLFFIRDDLLQQKNLTFKDVNDVKKNLSISGL